MKVNKYIDHTNLKPFMTVSDLKKLCNEAIDYQFMSVCVHPMHVKQAHQYLLGSDVKVCTVIGFPLGMNTTKTKVFEAHDAINNGADELDMVINIGMLKNKEYSYVLNEIRKVKKICGAKVLKIIIETCYLNEDEIIKMTEICCESGADFIKTSTGYGSYGARTTDIKIIKDHISSNIQIKASGGIKTYEEVKTYIDLGVNRIGTSNGVTIMEGIYENI